MIGKLTGFFFKSILLTVVSINNVFCAGDVIIELQNCRKIEDKNERLVCYDDNARRFAPPTITGKLGHITEIFKLDTPHLLRYRSRGVIFVLYLRDGEGNVLQNLHIGGFGDDEYVIDKPGKYSLKIDGSAAWDIWLEPLEDEMIVNNNNGETKK